MAAASGLKKQDGNVFGKSCIIGSGGGGEGEDGEEGERVKFHNKDIFIWLSSKSRISP